MKQQKVHTLNKETTELLKELRAWEEVNDHMMDEESLFGSFAEDMRRRYGGPIVNTMNPLEELEECPQCHVHCNLGEHECGECVALVRLEDTPRFQGMLMVTIIELRRLL